LLAIGDVVHQRSAHEVADEPVGNIGLFVKLLHDRSWWLGSLVSAGGFALQAAALGFGSVLLVQALLVSSLLFALLISAQLSRRAVSGWEWVWAVLLGAAVAVIVTVGNPQAGQSRASLQIWIGVAAVLGAGAGRMCGWRQDLGRSDRRGATRGGVRPSMPLGTPSDNPRSGPRGDARGRAGRYVFWTSTLGVIVPDETLSTPGPRAVVLVGGGDRRSNCRHS
jgi:hypothetical protein